MDQSGLPAWARMFVRHRSLIVPLGFVILLMVIIVPLPPVLMDVLIALNIAIAVIILMTTMYLEKPLDFSVFPSLLLGTTLLRLVSNIASTRLILTADASSPEQVVGVAGKVIAAFGSFVAGGSYVVGVILFVILVVVQFIVITKGASRISEVAARFTLDAMPGKQMAIDADLNAGIINEGEARQRREDVAREADFFGAMDGASKFVRGDAIAGIIITMINVIGGFVIGVVQKGWSAGDTATAFTILTIGDGIAAQVPAFVIAIASALIVTRSGTKQNLGEEFATQLIAKPVALYLTAAFVGLGALTPLPKVPLITIAVVIAGIGYFTQKSTRHKAATAQRADAEAKSAERPAAPPVEDLLKVDTLELEVGYGLVSLVDTRQGGDLLERISASRRQLAAELGLVMPPVRIRDNITLAPSTYRVKIRGSVVGEGVTRPGMLLAMDSGITTGVIQGEKTREPAFGLDAWWIQPSLKTRAETLNYTVVDPTSVLTTHLAELVKTHADELLTREEVNNLLENMKKHAPKLVEQTVPAIVSPGDLQKIMQNLLRERVPVRDLESILETLSDWAPRTKDLDILTEYTRNALRRSICQIHALPIDPERAADPNARLRIVCVTLDPAFEDAVSAYIDRSGNATTISIPASVASALSSRVSAALEAPVRAGHAPIVLASPAVRAQVRQILEPYIRGVTVLGYNEIVPGIEVESMGLVTLPDEAEAAPRRRAGAAAGAA
jgi:flagellar biosynthesis protein FlhA